MFQRFGRLHHPCSGILIVLVGARLTDFRASNKPGAAVSVARRTVMNIAVEGGSAHRLCRHVVACPQIGYDSKPAPAVASGRELGAGPAKLLGNDPDILGMGWRATTQSTCKRLTPLGPVTRQKRLSKVLEGSE